MNCRRQTLREIRDGGSYHGEKTGLALRLIAEGKYCFLSRLRRFGKSLFPDTLVELFERNVALFTGLAAERGWDRSLRRGLDHASRRQRAVICDSYSGYIGFSAAGGVTRH